MKLLLIRHGHTEIQDGEARLSREGILQSKKLSESLKKLKIDKVYTSDLERSKKTAEEYTKNFIEDTRLREIYRVLVGGPEKEGTSPERETNDKKRADEFFNEILNEKGTVAIFCHGNIIRYFLNKILKSKENLWEKLVLDNCSISIIENNEKGLFIKGINLKDSIKEILEEKDIFYND